MVPIMVGRHHNTDKGMDAMLFTCCIQKRPKTAAQRIAKREKLVEMKQCKRSQSPAK